MEYIIRLFQSICKGHISSSLFFYYFHNWVGSNFVNDFIGCQASVQYADKETQCNLLCSNTHENLTSTSNKQQTALHPEDEFPSFDLEDDDRDDPDFEMNEDETSTDSDDSMDQYDSDPDSSDSEWYIKSDYVHIYM